MLAIDFRGWFQCRIPTDPDPYDEPRGVSGYVRAYAGEPDLDRIVHWQPPGFSRALAPPVGVAVTAVALDGEALDTSPLVGAAVALHGSPRFEGRNGVIAEDGLEPLYPFDLEVSKGGVSLRRGVEPLDPGYPYEGMFGAGVDTSSRADIQQATGIDNLITVWRGRLAQLRKASPTTEPDVTARRERIEFLEDHISRPRGAGRFFGARVNYALTLNSPSPTTTGMEEQVGFRPDPREPWHVQFWLGGWDADVLCGYCVGRLTVVGTGSTPAAGGESSRTQTDRSASGSSLFRPARW